jgi:hypothetical protein
MKSKFTYSEVVAYATLMHIALSIDFLLISSDELHTKYPYNQTSSIHLKFVKVLFSLHWDFNHLLSRGAYQ